MDNGIDEHMTLASMIIQQNPCLMDSWTLMDTGTVRCSGLIDYKYGLIVLNVEYTRKISTPIQERLVVLLNDSFQAPQRISDVA